MERAKTIPSSTLLSAMESPRGAGAVSRCRCAPRGRAGDGRATGGTRRGHGPSPAHRGAARRNPLGGPESSYRTLAARLGVPFRGDASPEGKLARVEALRAAHGPVAVVGDGINDAAALAAADVGIALARGAALAVEAADVTLYDPDLRSLPWLVRLARQTQRTIRRRTWCGRSPTTPSGWGSPGWAAPPARGRRRDGAFERVRDVERTPPPRPTL